MVWMEYSARAYINSILGARTNCGGALPVPEQRIMPFMR